MIFMYVYVDVLFLLNWALTVLILASTSFISGAACSWSRILIAAALGSFYAIGALRNEWGIFYVFPAKIGVSLLLVRIAFGKQQIRSFLKLSGCFYVISFIFGGAVLGWIFLESYGNLFIRPEFPVVSWRQLAAGSLFAVLSVLFFVRFMASKIRLKGGNYSLKIHYCGQSLEIKALLDTGNGLFSPVMRRPVIIVDKEAVSPLLGEKVCQYLDSMEETDWLSSLEACEDKNWLARIEVIPYRGVGSASVLLGFRPDSVEIVTKEGSRNFTNVMIAIYGGCLASDQAYRALLHPLLLEQASYKEAG